MKNHNIFISLFPLILGLLFTVLIASGQSDELSIKKALTFYASFDGGTDADISRGDKRLFTLIGKEPKLGNKTKGMSRIVKNKGLSGDALLFTKRNAKWLLYDGAKNFHFAEKNWSGSVSF